MQVRQFPKQTAANSGLKSCEICMHLSPATEKYCTRCGHPIHFRKPFSVQNTLALLLAAAIFYIPANVYPIMVNTLLGSTQPTTIIGGIIEFFEDGSYFVAMVILVASLIIPMAKMLVILWLCYFTHKHSQLPKKDLTRLYKITEFIGKWSMIDVFVVAILVALVHITGIMVVEPGIAARAFAVVVILTMLAAHQFDMRLIWDKQKDE